MSHPYFFINFDDINDSEILIEGEDFEHLAKTLRARVGDIVELSDNNRYRFTANIKNIEKKGAILEIIKRKEIKKDFLQLDLFQSILKKNSMELVIQKSAEIGVTNIIPVFSSRVIPNEKPDNKKYIRWQKIALEASKQSKRNHICKLCPPENINNIDLEKYDLFLFAYEELSDLKTDKKEINKCSIIREIIDLKNKKPDYSAGILKIAFIIGPEGGFEREEANLLISKDARAISLGSNILKAETAAIFAASVIKCALS